MIAIVPYQTKWPDEFLALGKSLRQALGDLALRIDHIGSTSVPGLAAKDVIDIQVTVRSLEPEIEKALMRAGYERLIHINLVSTHSPDIKLPEAHEVVALSEDTQFGPHPAGESHRPLGVD